MERKSPESDPYDNRLSKAEMAGVFNLLAAVLIRKGAPDVAPDIYTPTNRPEALQFLIPVEPGVVKELFYPTDDLVEIIGDDTFLSYVTPGALDIDAEEEPESSVCLSIKGRFVGTNLFFNVGYLLTKYDEESPKEEKSLQNFSADVQIEYSENERRIEDGVIVVADDIVVFSEYTRNMTVQDGDRLRQLVDILS